MSASPQQPANLEEAFAKFRKYVDAYAEQEDADVLVYNGALRRPYDVNLLEGCAGRRRRSNVLLMVTTSGGDAGAAYRIARALQQHYKRFTAYVPGYCKSGGTLLVLGAHELVLSPHAELGPLDVQLSRTDELGERSSGLTPSDALTVLEKRATAAFKSAFDHLRFKVGFATPVAVDVARRLMGSLYGGIFARVDPIRLGEVDRANRIALEYGRRLIAKGQNATDDTLVRLVGGYPDHGFIIDGEEARELFKTVRAPNDFETGLAMREPVSEHEAFFTYFSSERPPPPDAAKAGAAHADQRETDGQAAGTRNGEGASDGAAPGGAAPPGTSKRSKRSMSAPS